MTITVDLRRRAVLRGLMIGAVLAATPPAWAQDAQSVTAQKVAREWLALADRGDGPGSWKAAGKKFQDSLTADNWTQALAAVRSPLGEVGQRAIIATNFDSSFPGAPEGDYAHVEFRTSFAHKLGGETITLEREADGAWHVIGYSIH